MGGRVGGCSVFFFFFFCFEFEATDGTGAVQGERGEDAFSVWVWVGGWFE